MSRANSSVLWDIFEKVDSVGKIAKCKVCSDLYSYKATTGNLKNHLRKKHVDAYRRVVIAQQKQQSQQRQQRETADTLLLNSTNDDASEQKRNDIWNYFEKENNKARCVVCHDIISDTSYDSLKAHLFAQHPKLLLDLVQDQDSLEETHLQLNSGTDEEDDDNNIFTEVVYLEQDAEETKPNKSNDYTPSRAKKRIRTNSRDNQIIKIKRDKDNPPIEEDNELDVFLKYIRCLLKKLSPDVFSKVQIDILKTIMDAAAVDKLTTTNNSSATSILTDIGHSSTGNVIKVSELGTENCSNFTVKLIDAVSAETVVVNAKEN